MQTAEEQKIMGIAEDEDSQDKLLQDVSIILNANIPDAVQSVYETAGKAVLTIRITIKPKKDSITEHLYEIGSNLSKPGIRIKRRIDIKKEGGKYQMRLFEQVE